MHKYDINTHVLLILLHTPCPSANRNTCSLGILLQSEFTCRQSQKIKTTKYSEPKPTNCLLVAKQTCECFFCNSCNDDFFMSEVLEECCINLVVSLAPPKIQTRCQGPKVLLCNCFLPFKGDRPTSFFELPTAVSSEGTFRVQACGYITYLFKPKL